MLRQTVPRSDPQQLGVRCKLQVSYLAKLLLTYCWRKVEKWTEAIADLEVSAKKNHCQQRFKETTGSHSDDTKDYFIAP